MREIYKRPQVIRDLIDFYSIPLLLPSLPYLHTSHVASIKPTILTSTPVVSTNRPPKLHLHPTNPASVYPCS